MSENFQKISLEEAPRTELHDKLGLTGAEVSVNRLPAGAAVPFVHAHKQNEELYGVLEGRGELWIDGEVVESRRATGSAFRPPASVPFAPRPTKASPSSASRPKPAASKATR